MARNDPHTYEARGEIVLWQEDRFRLRTNDGRSLLLVLGTRTNSSIEDLESLAGSGREVLVRYQGNPEEGAIATEIQGA